MAKIKKNVSLKTSHSPRVSIVQISKGIVVGLRMNKENTMKKHIPNITISIVAILLVSMYFYEVPQWFKIVASWIFVIYSILLILAIIVVLLVFLLNKLISTSYHLLDKDVLEKTMIAIDSIYSSVGSKEKTIEFIYSPIMSLIVVFFSFQSGLFFLMILEAVSELLNLSLLDKARNYIKRKKALENE